MVTGMLVVPKSSEKQSLAVKIHSCAQKFGESAGHPGPFSFSCEIEPGTAVNF